MISLRMCPVSVIEIFEYMLDKSREICMWEVLGLLSRLVSVV
jgi:hypothetical protein